MAMTGFDPVAVTTSITKIQSSYDSLMQALINDTQTKFVDEMAKVWACKQAQEFFNGPFITSIEELATGVTEIFESVVNSMNSTAGLWAARTGTTYTKKTFVPNNSKLNVSVIKENLNGVRGIDEPRAQEIKEALKITNIDSALDSAKAAVANCGFLGGEEELITTLGTIKNNVSTTIAKVLEATQSYINSTLVVYGDAVEKAKANFRGE